jgi:formyltetrahydrofolate synthetase
MDTNDRFLRQITIGQSATEKGRTRVVSISTFTFTLALDSESMKFFLAIVLVSV